MTKLEELQRTKQEEKRRELTLERLEFFPRLAFKREWPSGKISCVVMPSDIGGTNPVPNFKKVLETLLPKGLILKLENIVGENHIGVFCRDNFIDLLCPKKILDTGREFGIKWTSADLNHLERIYCQLVYERGPIQKRSPRRINVN